jgi:hypothetical protein
MTWQLTLSSPFLPPFLFLPCVFFCNKQQPPNHNTIQPPTTISVITILSLLIFMFWFKFCWGFSTLSKQIFLLFFLFELNFKMFIFLYIFIVYVFCLGIYFFYSFFFIQICCMDLWFVHVRVCFRFCKIIFFCKLMKLISNFWLRCFVMK